MHTAFTGNARKNRQINLSGRNVANPWAALQSGSTPAAGTQNALANAQADRLRRQQERDRQNASKKIQRVWRGHSTRRLQKQRWRQEWDVLEQQRLGRAETISYEEIIQEEDTDIGYESLNQCLTHLRLFSHFFGVAHETDCSRLAFTVMALQITISNFNTTTFGSDAIKYFGRLQSSISKQIRHLASEQSTIDSNAVCIAHILKHGQYLARVLPRTSAEDSTTQFQALSEFLSANDGNKMMRSLAIEFVNTLLLSNPPTNSASYRAFAKEILSKPVASSETALLDIFLDTKRLILLSQAIIGLVSSEEGSSVSNEEYIWMLSYLLFIRSGIGNDSNSFSDWIQATSALLSKCANEISERVNEIDQQMNGYGASRRTSLVPFQKEQISRLAQQQSVEQVVQQLGAIGRQENGPIARMAKPLANYAVALLRAFPHKALDIRMWLYRSSPTTGSSSISTIQYLWQAAQSTSVFSKIARDQRSVLSVLTEAAPEHNQIGRPQVSADSVAIWQEDWRIILLFLELYTFILKIMDDEEFFALDDRKDFKVKTNNSQFAQGALLLNDVATLTTFLKNLAFPLYWNAADLAETNEIEETGGISALFGTRPFEAAKPVPKREPKTLAGNGVSQAYLKDRVTALLRMLHERDSRRNFLPENHWLMTNHVDMYGFIPAVAAEEERRHDAGRDEEEDRDAIDNADDVQDDEESMALQSFTNMFGIRPPHTPRSHTSRFNDMMSKRRERERKRRQVESLVPRLEILRNLPFFIPFDTRVQIFREFVHQDQFRRRNGWVDPDEWRFAIANGPHGTGFDGNPRGVNQINRHHADIHRDSVFQDAFDSFYEIGEDLKEPIQISFLDQFGLPEAGIDGGGVTKEFLMSVTSEAFDPRREMPMFTENEQRLLFPNPKLVEGTHELFRQNKVTGEEATRHVRELLRRYEFLGRIVGKCMYEGILVDLNFAGFFLLKWALTGGTTSATNETAYRASINDLKDYDEELYQGLLKLKNYRGDVESDFGLDFTVTNEVQLDATHRYTWSKELISNGTNTPVTNGNRLIYIDKITRYRLQQQPMQVTNAFLKGLGQIIQPMWLAMFNQRELQKLVGGDNAELDIHDLRRNTQYSGLYTIGDDGIEHPTVAIFWKVLQDMDDVDRRKVLKFVTSTPRAPLLGFSHLNPRFSIRDSTEDQTRLPSTSTCVNLLKLPRYSNEQVMKEKLLYAINSGAGFDLS